MKMKSPSRWYVVADAGRASAYSRRSEGSGYDEVGSWTSDLVRPKDQRPQFTDRPGRVFDSLGAHRHAAETASPTELAREAFGRELAQTLNKARSDGAFQQLVVFAAPKLLHELRTHFDKATADAIVHSEAKDLTKLPQQELSAVFDSMGIGPGARA